MVTGVWVDGPLAEPRPYGLFTAAQVVEDATPRWLIHGTEHEVDYCGEAHDSAGVCFAFGSASLDLSDARAVLIGFNGQPDGGDYRVWWGDEGEGNEGPETFTTSGVDGADHTYAEDGTYTILVRGPRSYSATVTLEVADGEAQDDVSLEVGIGKEPHVGVEVVHGDPFVVLHLLECTPVGRDDDLAERARAALMMGEQRTVERVFSAMLARDTRTATLAGGDALSAVDALAALEKYAGANYPGRATIHATPDLVTLLDAKGAVTLRTVNGIEQIVTGQGTKVVSGGGYDLREPTIGSADLPANDDGMAWLYVTGAVQVRRTSVIEAHSAVNLTGGTGARNQSSYLAERPYVVTADCVVAAVQVAATEAGPA